jgi:hypothetical protein
MSSLVVATRSARRMSSKGREHLLAETCALSQVHFAISRYVTWNFLNSEFDRRLDGPRISDSSDCLTNATRRCYTFSLLMSGSGIK